MKHRDSGDFPSCDSSSLKFVVQTEFVSPATFHPVPSTGRNFKQPTPKWTTFVIHLSASYGTLACSTRNVACSGGKGWCKNRWYCTERTASAIIMCLNVSNTKSQQPWELSCRWWTAGVHSTAVLWAKCKLTALFTKYNWGWWQCHKFFYGIWS